MCLNDTEAATSAMIGGRVISTQLIGLAMSMDSLNGTSYVLSLKCIMAAAARSHTTSERTNINVQAAGEFALDCPP